MATEDRERLEAIANALMAPHVDDQKKKRQRFQDRREGFLRRNRMLTTSFFVIYLGYVVFRVIPRNGLEILPLLVLLLLGWSTWRSWSRTG